MDQNTQKPLVSVNICTFNRANLISKAINSVLTQNYPNIEIIVVDDYSSDNTEDIVKDLSKNNPNIFYYKNPQNIGMTPSRIVMMEKSSGKYIAVLDSDDYWTDTNKISDQVELLENNPEIGLVGTFTTVVDSNDNKIGECKFELQDKQIRSKILLQNQFTHSSALFRREPDLNYDKNYRTCDDISLWLKIGKKYKFANIPKFQTSYKKHDNNMTKSRKYDLVLTLNRVLNEYKSDYPKYHLAKLKNILRLLRSVL